MLIDLALKRHTKRVVQIDPAKLARHSVVLAQSGSGKSFMLGRLVEELAVKTKAKMIIFDPNSDFIKLDQLDDTVWSDARYKPWFFPRESSVTFTKSWKSVGITVASNRNLPGARRLVLDWGRLSHDEMASVMNIDPQKDSELYWCLFLTWEVASETWTGDIEPYFDFDHFRDQADNVVEFLLGGKGTSAIKEIPLARNLRQSLGQQVAFRFKSLVYSIEKFQIWRSSGDGEIDVRDAIPGGENGSRILVVDLQSLSSVEERYSIVNSVLTSVWTQGMKEQWEAIRDFKEPDPRIPTFIVIDEAHNLIPGQKSSPDIEKLSAQFVRIAAEGRKYALHLVIATQRPRKIDGDVLTECDNIFLMRMTNDNDLQFAAEALGYLPMRTARRSRILGVGEVILAGAIRKGAARLHVSPRRTVQGGRDISKTWILP